MRVWDMTMMLVAARVKMKKMLVINGISRIMMPKTRKNLEYNKKKTKKKKKLQPYLSKVKSDEKKRKAASRYHNF